MRKIFLLLTILSSYINAETSGDLDKTFATKGLFAEGTSIQTFLSLDTAVDSQGRILVLYAFEVTNEYNIGVYRLLVDGTKDNTYQTYLSDVDKFLIDGNFSIAIDANDGVFFGYSNYTCTAPNTDCQQDVFVRHFDNTGTLTGSQTIAFDLGSTYLRQNDVFADLVYIPDHYGHNTEMLAVAATVDYSNVYDTDFGVALMDVAPDGSLSMRTTFSGDGKTTCAFDQDINNSGVGIDQAVKIIVEYANPLQIVIGGNAFEGNGVNNDGWNLAFCEVGVTGNINQSWSTEPLADTLNDVELLQDMYYSSYSDDVVRLMVGVKFSTGTDNDFYIGEYRNVSSNWFFETNFGTNGWSSVGFSELFIGNTNDEIQSIIYKPNHTISVVGNMSWIDNGNYYSKVALARFDEWGQLMTSWGTNGTKTFDFSQSISGPHVTEVNGMSYDANKKELYLVGLSPDGVIKRDYVANILDNIDIIFLNGFE